MPGKFKLLNRRPFRTGGLADLELCELHSGRTAVHRQLQDQYKFNLAIRSRFVKGLEARQKLGRHENIVWSYEFGRFGLVPYELIDYVDGPNLQELLSQNPAYVRSRGLEMLLQIAQAIQHCHDNGIVHLDIKPANIIVDIHGDTPMARLTDFDLALPADTGTAGKKIRMGTFEYMPLEMLDDGEVSPHADVFAFGVLAYHICTGKMPFEGSNAAESRAAKRDPHAVIPPMNALYPETPRQLCVLVNRCLDRRRDYRGTMKAIVKELCQIIAVQALEKMKR